MLGLTWLADIMRKSAHSDRLWWRHVVFASVDRPFAERAVALSEPENAQNVRFLPAPTPVQHCDGSLSIYSLFSIRLELHYLLGLPSSSSASSLAPYFDITAVQ